MGNLCGGEEAPQSNSLNLDQVISATHEIFSEINQAQVPTQVTAPTWSIHLDEVIIPIISENTSGGGQHLIFNTLNSCYGLIGFNPVLGNLKGAHFSLVGSYANSATSIAEIIVDWRKKGYQIQSFGKSSPNWEREIGPYLSDNPVTGFDPADTDGAGFPPIIDNDDEEVSWYFSIEERQLIHQTWEVKNSTT